jgi:hypothetical protein
MKQGSLNMHGIAVQLPAGVFASLRTDEFRLQ